ncbi:MAG TPA: NUDIX domain-containing protein [Egicoccus sp.]|nr:NUDIX domain-containing protein [Egicoccus sp.]HSK23407.1 NUDIX domain-containing protein [Egicoccus sp.]
MSEPTDPAAGRPRAGLRAHYVHRVTPADVGSRVSVRHLVPDPDRGVVPSDIVGRLLVMDEAVLLLVDRQGQLIVVDATAVVASRVVPPHPKLPPEPADVGTQEQPLVRHAARVLLLDPLDRVLLVAHAPTASRRVWTAPGGGLKPGESHEQAAARELREELGVEPRLGPWIWWRRVTFPFRGLWLDQEERWFLARAEVDVAAAPLDDLEAVEARWWSLDELSTTRETLAPAALPEHLARLRADGPPSDPLDVGR